MEAELCSFQMASYRISHSVRNLIDDHGGPDVSSSIDAAQQQSAHRCQPCRNDLDSPDRSIPFPQAFEVRVDPPEAGGPSNWASQIVAQPLSVSDVKWSDGTTKDVLVIGTMHGTVYAFDAKNDCAPLWETWLGMPVMDLPGSDQKDIWGTTPEWGILSTPAIDPDL